jgi:hypothetical protein
MKFVQRPGLSPVPVGVHIRCGINGSRYAAMEKPIEDLVKAQVAQWHGVTPPNPSAEEAAKAMAGLIESFEKLRGELRFEDEPSSFEAALLETKERSP